jgi:hypothetical protein
MYYVMSLSGGLSSAVAADRAIARHGRRRVLLWFADTSWEDGDLHRFLGDCMARWGGRLYRYRDGRTPLQVAEDRRIIPNQKHAPCSFVLKIEPFTRWLWTLPKPVTVLLGLDWREMHRITERRRWHRKAGKPRAPVGYARKVAGVYEDFPHLWKPYEFRPYAEVVRSWGIEPPRLYAAGFSHNNCGGRCVKEGIAEWLLLRDTFPERFAEVRDWEGAQRALGGKRAAYAIARDQSGGKVVPLTLAEIEGRRATGQRPLFDDRIACFCEA